MRSHRTRFGADSAVSLFRRNSYGKEIFRILYKLKLDQNEGDATFTELEGIIHNFEGFGEEEQGKNKAIHFKIQDFTSRINWVIFFLGFNYYFSLFPIMLG